MSGSKTDPLVHVTALMSSQPVPEPQAGVPVHAAIQESELSGQEQELEKEIVKLEPYRRPWWRLILWILGIVCTGGLLGLASLWSINLRTWLTLERSSLQDADYVFVELRDKRSGISKVHRAHSTGFNKAVRYFIFHAVRFMYNDQRRTFEAVPVVPSAFSYELGAAKRAVTSGATPYSPPPLTRLKRQTLFGDNLLKVESPSFLLIFSKDALQPFYCFQYMSVIIWSIESYYTYSAVVLFITLASLITNAISQYRERKRMAEMAYYVTEVELVRSTGTPTTSAPGGGDSFHGGTPGAGGLPGPNGHALVPSSVLVPGDIVVVSPGKIAFDAILLEGECVVDETVLTGESVPVRKTAYDPELDGPTYNSDTFNHCSLFNGTTVAAARGGRGSRPALAIVVATGFNTAKGRLLRAIMFPRQHDLDFVRQAIYFICVMMTMALIFYIVDAIALAHYGASPFNIGIKSVDMITVAVPPALAACLAIATTISVARLRTKDVNVLDTERVPMAGLLDAVCFDKTGTLTEIGLELGGVVPVDRARLQAMVPDPQRLPPAIKELFGACHGLTQLGDTVVGDPLDQRLFDVSGFEMRFEEEMTPALMAAGWGPSTSPTSGLKAAEASVVPSWPMLVLRHCPEQPQASAPLPPADTQQPGGGAIQMLPLLPGKQPSLAAAHHYSDHPVHTGSGTHPASLSARRGSLESPLNHAGGSGTLDRMLSGGSGGQQGRVSLEEPQHAGVGPSLLHKLSSFGRRPGSPVGSPGRESGSFTLPSPQQEAAVVRASDAQHPAAIDPKHRAIAVAGAAFAPSETLHVLRRFDFSSERLRSTCCVLHPDGRVMVYTKGSPERLLTLMDPASVPHDFAATLKDYTNQGLRVLAVACREVTGLSHPSEALTLTQDQLEEGAACLGLVLMVNRLKPESAPAIRHLHSAAIRTAMVTGDHARTAITVARQCEIMDDSTAALVVDADKGALWEADLTFEVVEAAGGGTSSSPRHAGPSSSTTNGHAAGSLQITNGHSHRAGLDSAAAIRGVAAGELQLAVTGRAWQKLNSDPDRHAELLSMALERGRVFARMSPDDKRLLIELLGFGTVDSSGRARTGLGYYTGYCGDGANDLGALKGALVGVSLCDAEASIAAPMTSRIPHIGSMITVIAEGRCSMVTTLIIFKYTMVYAYAQVLSLAMLYNMGLMVGNYQYLIQDMFHTTLLATCMSLTAPASTLSVERPLPRVLSMGVILPVLAQVILVTIFQGVGLALLRHTSWYTPYRPTPEAPALDIAVSEAQPETGVLMVITCWQLIILALVFNVGHPFRKGLWTNRWLLITLLALIGFDLYVTWAPGDPFKRRGPAVADMPLSFRAILFFLALLNLVAAYLGDWLAKGLFVLGKKALARRREAAGMAAGGQRNSVGAPKQQRPLGAGQRRDVELQARALQQQSLLPVSTSARGGTRSDSV